jgi:hypothetical protein
LSERERPWSVPVAVREVPETGRQLTLAADERTRAAIAKLAQLRALPRFEAVFDVTRHGRDGLRVAGRLSATVGQVCVVTLEPMDNDVEEHVDLVFAPSVAPPLVASEVVDEVEITTEDTPEPLIGGVVDLGVIATEFLMLAIDLYPRKPGAAFEAPPAGDDSEHPFAALAALKKPAGRKNG